MNPTTSLQDPDPELVRRAVDGDQDALYAILRHLQGPVLELAMRMLRHRADAEDACQEALIRIATHLGQFRGESRFWTWAFRVAVNRILDLARARAEIVPTDFDALAADLAVGRRDDAVERAEDAVLLGQLKVVCSRAMLQCLRPDERVIFVLGDVLGLSSEEGAAVLEIERPAFRKRLSRARAALQEFLSSHCGVYDAGNPCGCHRRLARAIELGRVQPGLPAAAAPAGLADVRRHLASVSEARRVTEFFRSDPAAPQRDLVEALRSMLVRLAHSEARA